MPRNELHLLNIVTYVLKMHINCQGCRNKVKKLLRKIEGVYAVKIDAEGERVMVSGIVDPDTLINKLLRSFSVHGTVSRAFIPSKTTKTGKRFGFVFFLSPDVAASAVAAKNRSWFGSDRLIVDFALRPSQTSSSTPKANSPRAASKQRSFKEVVAGNVVSPPPSFSGPGSGKPLSVSGSLNPWSANVLRSAVIGVARDNRSFAALHAALPRSLLGLVTLHELGGRAFLICFNSAEALKSAEALAWIELRPLFSDFFLDLSSVFDGGCFGWISLKGIPLSGWSVDSIRNIASAIGTVIVVHQCSSSFTRLDEAFVLIFSRRPVSDVISVDLEIERSNFPIWVTGCDSHLVLVSDPFDPELVIPEDGAKASDQDPLEFEDGEIHLDVDSPLRSPLESEWPCLCQSALLRPAAVAPPPRRGRTSPSESGKVRVASSSPSESFEPLASMVPESAIFLASLVPKTTRSLSSRLMGSDLLRRSVFSTLALGPGKFGSSTVDLGLSSADLGLPVPDPATDPKPNPLSAAPKPSVPRPEPQKNSSFVADIASPSTTPAPILSRPKRKNKRIRNGNRKLIQTLKDVSPSRSLRKKSEAKRAWALCKSMGFTSSRGKEDTIQMFQEIL